MVVSRVSICSVVISWTSVVISVASSPTWGATSVGMGMSIVASMTCVVTSVG